MQSLWMLFASLGFTLMGVCIKLASSWYSTAEIVMYRGLIGVIVMFSVIKVQRGALTTAFPREHLWRSGWGVISLWLWFYAIAHLPLATAMTLNYMSPIWIAAILFVGAWWRGSARFEWGLMGAILMSFLGVILLLRPSLQTNQWHSGLVALLSGVLAAFAYLQVRQLGQLGEPEYRVVFYFSLTSMLAGLLGSVIFARMSGAATTSVWHTHTWHSVALLLGLGISATLAQVAMTRAYRLGKTLVTANLQYTGIVFASFLGIVLWGDVLNGWGWAGIGLILASGMATTFYNARQIKSPPAAASDVIATEM